MVKSDEKMMPIRMKDNQLYRNKTNEKLEIMDWEERKLLQENSKLDKIRTRISRQKVDKNGRN